MNIEDLYETFLGRFKFFRQFIKILNTLKKDIDNLKVEIDSLKKELGKIEVSIDELSTTVEETVEDKDKVSVLEKLQKSRKTPHSIMEKIKRNYLEDTIKK